MRWLFLLAILSACAAAAQDTPSFSARLLAPPEALDPGSSGELLVELTIQKDWHIYHPIVLDTGAPTRFEWSAPPAMTIDDVRYPPPALEKKADLEFLALSGTVACLAPVRLDDRLRPGQPLEISVRISALACKEQCVQVEATAATRLMVGQPNPGSAAAFKKARAEVMAALPDAKFLKGSAVEVSPATVKVGDKAEVVATLKVQPGLHIQDRKTLPALVATRMFVESIDGITVEGAKQQWPRPRIENIEDIGEVRTLSGALKVRAPFEVSDKKAPSGLRLMRVLVQYQACKDNGECYAPEVVESIVSFRVENPQVPAVAVSASQSSLAPLAGAAEGRSRPVEGSWLEVLLAVLSALAGGLILNVMPCVLPVLSLKVLGFVQQGQSDPRRALRLGAVFSLGILAWFWVLFAVTSSASLALRDLFQNPLQNPWIVMPLASLLFLMALNLLGVFEIVLPGRFSGLLDTAAAREGYPGALLKGFVATLLGTACVAPFLVGATSYAITQPPLISFAIFTAAGIGMASPYLLLSAKPQWLGFIPRPGAWMVTFKQLMGFLLVATALWLLWVLSRHWGGDGTAVTVIFWGFLALAAWVIGKIRPGASGARAGFTWLVAGALGIGGYLLSFRVIFDPRKPVTTEHVAVANDVATPAELDRIAAAASSDPWTSIPWVPFRPGLGAALAQRGYTVFVDYTADWCLTCKTNLRLVLETAETRALMKSLGVIPIEADFTRSNPAIRADLDSFKRSGVPLNIVYPAGKPSEPLVLGALLTKKEVADALNQAGRSRPPNEMSARLP